MIVDDERSPLLDALPVPHFSLSGPKSLGFVNLFNIRPGLDPLQENMGILSLVVGLDLVTDNQRKFRNFIDSVTLGHNKSWDSSSGNGRDHSVTLLGHINLAVPTAVDFSGGEHVTTTAHVTESTLTGAVSTTTTDTWDTSNSTTGTPGFGTGLVT